MTNLTINEQKTYNTIMNYCKLNNTQTMYISEIIIDVSFLKDLSTDMTLTSVERNEVRQQLENAKEQNKVNRAILVSLQSKNLIKLVKHNGEQLISLL